MSTEARVLIRDGDRGEGGAREWRLDRARRPGRPRRPWTAARTAEVLRRCPLAIAHQLVCITQLLFQLLCGAESQGQCPLHRC